MSGKVPPRLLEGSVKDCWGGNFHLLSSGNERLGQVIVLARCVKFKVTVDVNCHRVRVGFSEMQLPLCHSCPKGDPLPLLLLSTVIKLILSPSWAAVQ